MFIQKNNQNELSQKDQDERLNNKAESFNIQTENSQTLKIDSVIFSLSRCKKSDSPTKLLKEKYDSKSNIGQKSNFDNLKPTHQENKNLTLQSIELLHYHSVLQTDQEKFHLRKSDYKKHITLPGPFFQFNQLWKIKFPFLKLLDLSSSKLLTLQPLTFIDMPQIKRLELHDNQIYTLNPLNKCQFKNLEYLSFYENTAIEFSLSIRGNFPNLNRIIADSDRIQKDLTRETDKNTEQNSMYRIDIIFKLQNLFRIIELKMNTRKRILPSRFKQVLRTINPRIKLKNKLTNEDLMMRLERLGGIGTRNDPQTFRRFLNNDVQPVLRDRERNPNHLNAINQIREGLWQRLRQLQATVNQQRAQQHPQIQEQIIANYQRPINEPERQNLHQASGQNRMVQQDQVQGQEVKDQQKPVLTRSSSIGGKQEQQGQLMDVEGENKDDLQKQNHQFLQDKRENKQQRVQKSPSPVTIAYKLQNQQVMRNLRSRNFKESSYKMQEQTDDMKKSYNFQKLLKSKGK